LKPTPEILGHSSCPWADPWAPQVRPSLESSDGLVRARASRPAR
jgi:hypothetical protein